MLRRPGELAVRLLFYTVILVVFAALWSAAAAASGGRVVGYSAVALLWYVTVAEAAVIATKPRLIEDIGVDIGTGAVATELLRPVSMLWLRLASELGEAVVRLAMALAIGTAFTWAVGGAPPARAGALLLGTMRTAVVEAWSNRRSFWLQASAMILNDAAWVAFWALFFHKIGQVRGWRSDQVMLMFAILATVTGISMGLLANARKLGQLVADGQLDTVLTLPVDPLAYLLVRRVDTALLGDLAFGPVLFAVAAHPTPQRTALYVFGGLTKLMMFTVIPAAFLTGVPVHLVDHFRWATLAAMLGVAVGSVLLAGVVFRAGLRRYRSGALWTRA